MREVPFPASLAEDLMLDELLAPLLKAGTGLTADPAEIRRRNAALAALLNDEALTKAAVACRDALDTLEEVVRGGSPEFYQVVHALPIFRELHDAMDGFCRRANAAAEKADALAPLTESFRAALAEGFRPDFASLQETVLPEPESVRSFSYRFHFSEDLRVTRVDLLSMNPYAYKARSLLRKLVGGGSHEMEMIAQDMGSLRAWYHNHSSYTVNSSDSASAGSMRAGRNLFRSEVRDAGLPNIFGVMLGAEPQLASAEGQRLRDSTRAAGRRLLDRLQGSRTELAFLAASAELIRSLKEKGIPFAFAEVSDDPTVFTAKAAVHPAAAMRLPEGTSMVPNDMRFSQDSRLQLLTGTNGGGKTTYLRTMGALQVFFQLGLPVPAESACIGPVDSILCAFSAKENADLHSGKLGQELAAVRETLNSRRGFSLLLFNEPVTGASAEECVLISRELLAALTRLPLRGLWVTHLFGLVDHAARLNESLPGAEIGFLHIDEENSFRVLPGRGAASSHAEQVFRSAMERG